MRSLPAALLFGLMTIAGAATLMRTDFAPSSTATSTSTASVAALGDVSAFLTVVTDTATLVEKNDLAGAKSRIKDLELAWDAAEAGLKPRSPTAWHRVDDAIDAALAALRASTPTKTDSAAALSKLTAILKEG